jgi:hypothetical protein
MWRIIMFGWLFALFGCERQEETALELPALHREKDMKIFYPVLRNYDPADPYAATVVHRPIADGLAVFACRRIPRPQGRIGIDYVMKANLSVYNLSEEEILAACYENFFAASVKVDVYEQDESKLFQFSSDHRLVAAILGHKSTYPKLAEMTDSANIAVLIMSPDVICVTPVGRSFEHRLADIAEESAKEPGVIDLTPSVYYWTETGELVPESEWKRRDATGRP